MTRLVWLACAVCLALFSPGVSRAQDVIEHGRFEQVHLYRPAGQPRQFVLFLSGDKGWSDAEAAFAELLVKHGAMVAGVDMPGLEAKLSPDEMPVGDLENLAHFLQGYARVTTFHTPLLAASPSALAFAQAVNATAPPEIFGGVMVADDAASLVVAYDALAATHGASLPRPPGRLAGLPLVEVPTTGPATTPAAQDTFAVFLSGDGGWAGLDEKVAGALAAQGIPVVGLDSLRYFWRKRTPEGLAGDLDRIVRHYATHWNRRRVVLIGYSQGANVLPASFNRLSKSSRSGVTQLVLIALEDRVAWQFHLTNWVGAPRDAELVLPEASKLHAATTLCLYGEGDAHSLCDKLPAESATAQELPGGHHFNGDFDELAARILGRLN